MTPEDVILIAGGRMAEASIPLEKPKAFLEILSEELLPGLSNWASREWQRGQIHLALTHDLGSTSRAWLLERDSACITITCGLPIRLRTLAALLLSYAGGLKVLLAQSPLDDLQKRYIIPPILRCLFGHTDGQVFWNQHSFFETYLSEKETIWDSEDLWSLADRVAELATRFCAFHECTHVLAHHLRLRKDYQRLRRDGRLPFSEAEFIEGMELMADAHAGTHLAYSLIRENAGMDDTIDLEWDYKLLGFAITLFLESAMVTAEACRAMLAERTTIHLFDI